MQALGDIILGNRDGLGIVSPARADAADGGGQVAEPVWNLPIA